MRHPACPFFGTRIGGKTPSDNFAEWFIDLWKDSRNVKYRLISCKKNFEFQTKSV